MQNSAGEFLCIGRIVGTHGLRGDLKVHPGPGSDTLLGAERVSLRRTNGKTESHRILRAIQHKNNILIRLEGLSDLEAVQPLVNSEVLISRAELAALPEDEHYWFQLEGLRVQDRRRGDLGRLEEMFTTAAHDVYVVRGPYGEVMIPAAAGFGLEIDPGEGRLVVDLPGGLLEEVDDG